MSDQEPEPRYVGSIDAARILGVSVKTIRRAAVSGQVPAVRVGGEWRFLLDDLRTLTRRKTDS